MRLFLRSSVIVAVFSLLLLAAPSANASSCVSNATGLWSATGTWTSCAGGIPLAADTVQISGGFTVTVDVSNAVAASIQLGGPAVPSAGTLVFNSGSHVVVAGTVTIGSGLASNGTITMTNGGTLSVHGFAIGGGVGSKTWTPGTGTVVLTLTNTLPATIITSFSNLTTSVGTTTLGVSLPVNGTLTQNGGNIAVGAFTLTVAGTGTHSAGTNTVSGAGGYTLASGATLQSGHTGGVGGNITTTTKTLHTAANYTFNGSSAQVTSATMPATVHNLTVNNSAGVTLSANVAVNSDLTVTSGTLDLGSFTANRVSSGGTITVSDGATLKIGGTNSFPTNYSAKTLGAISTVEYDGTAQAVGAQNYGHLTLSNSGLKTFGTVPASNIRIAGALTISGTATTDLITQTTNVSYDGSGAQTILALTYYDLTASTSGTKTLAANATVNNSLTVANSAILDLSSFTANRASAGGTLTLSSTASLKIGSTNTLPSNYSTHVIGATTTVEYSGTTQSVAVLNSSQDYGHLIISGSGTKTLAGTAVVAGNLTVSAGTFDLGSNTINRLAAGGTLTVSNGAALKIGGTNTIPTNYTAHSIGATSTIEYGGTTQSVIVLNSAQNYGHLTISGSGTKTLAGTNNVAGDLMVSAGTFDLGSFTANRTIAGGTLTISPGAALKIGGTNTFPSNYSTHSIAATSTVEYSGTTQSVAVLNSAQDYGHLIISGSATKTLAGAENTVGNLTISAGIFTANNFNMAVGGTWTDNATFTAGTGTVTLNGSGAQNISGSSTTAFYNLTVTKAGGTATAAIVFNVDNNLNLTQGILTIESTSAYIFKNLNSSSGTTFNQTPATPGSLYVTGDLAIDGTYNALYNSSLIMQNAGGINSIRTGTATGALVSGQIYNGISFLFFVNGDYRATGATSCAAIAYMGNATAGTFETQGYTATFPIAIINGGSLLVNAGSGGANGILNSTFAGWGIRVGYVNSAGSMDVASGCTVNASQINIGYDATHIGTVSHSGGTINTGDVLIESGSSYTASNSPLINVTGNWTNNGGTFTPASNLVVFNGTGAQGIGGSSATTFNNLTISNTGNTVTSSVNSSVAGNLSISSGTLNLGAFTANRASSGGTLTVSNGATLKIGGTNSLPSNFSAHSMGATSTVEYSGTTQSVAVLNSADYGHLKISGSAITTLAGTQNVVGNLTVSAGTFDLGANTINRTTAGGTLSVSGTATLKIGGTNTLPANYSTHSITGLSTVEYAGTNQTVAALNSGQEYNGLTISGSGTKTLTGDLNVAGNLTLTSGTITTGAYTIYSKASGNVFRVSGWVNGNLKRFISTGAPARIFNVGDATNYTPVNIVFASVTTGGDLTVSVVASDHANIGTSTINAAKTVNRIWAITNNGMVFTTYGATFTFVAGDIDGGANTAAFIVGKYSAGWTYPTVGTKTATTTQATGLTAFGDFQIGEEGAPGAISGTVFEDTNYGGGAGRSHASSSGAAVPGARVELYTAAGNYSTFATTDGSGNYSFINLSAATYTVRVVNGTVNSSRTGTEVLPPVQTYRTDASSGAAVAVTNHVGGEVPASVDAGNGSTTLAALTAGAVTPQSITSAVVSASNIPGVDFGYSYDVIVNKNDSGQGSLRQFLLNANALSNTGLAQSGLTSGKDNAVFMLADGIARAGLTASYSTQFASGIASITVGSVLPTITDPVILDASWQPGYAGVPMIELNGAAVANAGLTITAGNSTVRGFIINRFNGGTNGIGISISAGGSNTITGNYIGTNAAGTTAAANSGAGIFISSANNTVGGTTVAARNVISGNTSYGVGIDGVGNTGNLIEGNCIGTNAAGTAALANSSHGVYVFNGAGSNTIGGTAAGAGNLISGNAGKGVVIAAGTGNAILSNSTHGNTGIGIDLTDDGVTANNGTKSGALANSGMDTPVFTTKTLAGTSLTISGYVGSAAGQSTFAGASVQVFKSDNDASGFGEGQTLLGTLTADASGNFGGTITVSLAVGDKITATATDASNNTSEFGANATLAAPPPNVALVNSVLPSGTQPPGTDLVYTVVFTNGGGQGAQVFIVIDPIPAHTDFKLGSQSTNLGTTGLTVAINYSNDNALTWTYTPVSGAGGAPAGYDRAVTHVRWSFTGNLSQGSPNNTGSISLTAKIR